MQLYKKQTSFEDARGKIIDILENEPIEYVTMITSKEGAVRGNHYHQESWQFTFLISGEIKCAIQELDKEVEIAIMQPGDLLVSPPNEIHTLMALKDSEFMVFTRGPRGGKNYEQDTFRIAKSLL